MSTHKSIQLSLFFAGILLWPHPALHAGNSPSVEVTPDSQPPKRVGVLSSLTEPPANTSQGLYIRILREAGLSARAVSAEEVKAGVLDELDIFIIGGGSGTKFNTSLGQDGCAIVTEFVRNGGGVLASCAGGYSFVRGHNEALSYLEIANARCVDTENGRWARGKGVVDIAADNAATPSVRMFYANGPIWEITNEPGFGITKALATFVTEVKKDGDPGGVMAGTPAILGGTFGKGRFVLFSAHPEFHSNLGNHPLVSQAARWVVQGPLKQGESVDWKSVFPAAADGQPNP
jgi:putative intracellular protease/amidase